MHQSPCTARCSPCRSMDAHCTRRTTRQLERRELRDCSSYTASHWPGKRLRLVDDEPSVEPRLTSESDSKADSDDEDAAYLASPGPAVVAWDSPMPSDCPPNRKKNTPNLLLSQRQGDAADGSVHGLRAAQAASEQSAGKVKTVPNDALKVNWIEALTRSRVQQELCAQLTRAIEKCRGTCQVRLCGTKCLGGLSSRM